MALVKTSKQIVTIRGRCGGNYFKHSPDGQHIHAMPRKIRGVWCGGTLPSIASYTFVAKVWMMVAVGVFAAIWATFALVWTFATKTGEQKKISGYNWYIHYGMKNSLRWDVPFWKPPRSPTNLPNYIAIFRGVWTYQTLPDDWTDESPCGYYYIGELFNGKLTYVCDDRPWVIWWKAPIWVISEWQGLEPVGMTFYGQDDQISGDYLNPATNNWSQVRTGETPL